MAKLSFGGDFEVTHPVATGFDKQNLSITALTHQSQQASREIPRQRKERGPNLGAALVAVAPTATDQQALVGIHKAYTGTKKPVLLLDFRLNDGVWIASLGEARIEIHATGNPDGLWTAYLIGRKRQQLLRSRASVDPDTGLPVPTDTPFRAARALVNADGWLYHGGAWRSLAWVYRSVQYAGLSHVDLPESYETGCRSGENLHVAGSWLWQPHSGRKVITRVTTLPDNRGMQRFGTTLDPKTGLRNKPVEPMPDLRNEIAYIQDVDVHGRMKRSRATKAFVQEPLKNAIHKPGNHTASAPDIGTYLDPYTGGCLAMIQSGAVI